jgi:hypothetical protein
LNPFRACKASLILRIATDRNPSWVRPLALFTYLAMARRRKIVRLPSWARFRGPLIRRVLRGLGSPADFAVPTALLRD